MAIYLRLVGGLGNQLFGYAAGIFISQHLNRDVVFDVSQLDRGLTKHGVTLVGRGLRGDFVERIPALDVENPVLREFRRQKIKTLSYEKRKNRWSAQIEKLPKNALLEGHFLDAQFFSSLRGEQINRERILLASGTTNWFEEMKLEMLEERPIAIHVRRGDYRKLENRFGLLGTDYYSQAIDCLDKLDTGKPVWVFSDEPAAAEELFAGMRVDAKVIYPPTGSDAGESLYLMSMGKAHILSNSTFASWAAYLSDSRSTVLYPKPWFRVQNSTDIALPGWKEVQHEFHS